MTPATDSGEGSIFYLDRQTVDCSRGGAVTGFHLFRPTTNSFVYQYDCATGYAISKNSVQYKKNGFTDTNSNEKASAHYLDRQSVQCPQNFALQSFHLVRQGGQVAYEYNCVQIKAVSCGKAVTDKASNGGKETYFLDRQYIQLPAGQVLTGFHLVTDGANYFYEVNYCTLHNVNAEINGL